MEFLRSLLRRRFARAQVATSRDVGCFLRLPSFDQTKLTTQIVNAQCAFAVLYKMLRILLKLRVNLDPVA